MYKLLNSDLQTSGLRRYLCTLECAFIIVVRIVYCGRYMKLCSQYCVMLLGRPLNTCHRHLFYLSYYITCKTFICSKDRVLYITLQNRMPKGTVVLHTGNFLGYCQGCGVLTVLYYKMVLKCTAHKRTYTAEGMDEVLQLMKDEVMSMQKVNSSYVYDGTL